MKGAQNSLKEFIPNFLKEKIGVDFSSDSQTYTLIAYLRHLGRVVQSPIKLTQG